ncbi:MAG TPA: EamA family transporter RarD [Chloroflexus aurantiacus]|jgi:chloramphenicol-sensitive protein RarD|uniref:RarD protein, DMT superfamily transporter n=1 Tax=Chloroflexus aurantiacus (strain ATCC 29366 / DSM 635 / J-10-fl) TaxID=324602 RepID=A9WC62_CHLAA|nr:EamA family transporter RarD [Chloroflexus aurantiacus]ABY33455.1 RarD protein, DMT superfamily transporter [Chloroflexus aurantiacus J-10-fl]RMG46346.1 MAG: EamA family transporter RarD [Chloroflexota bacterium]GIV92860.1 MAG: membrane protein [Chloroflexus sp.]HBW67506.1 EamA family transporter RarD [Chloroflexus aurantiacus]
MTNKTTLQGISAAIAAYALWGLLPVYWKALNGASATEILAHRMIWSLLFLLGVLAIRRQWEWITVIRQQRRLRLTYLASAILLAANWGIYVWAVQINRVVEASLGYFINPLVSIALGVLVLRERLRPAQWLAIGIAAAGVAWLTYSAGALPWIALALALSFGLYGLLRKQTPLGSFEALTVETLWMFPPALLWLSWLAGANGGIHHDTGLWMLLISTGVVTAAPLLFFGAATRRIPLTTIGILQYLAPTLQLVLGVLVYGEPFSTAQLIGFGAIWTALAIYTLDSFIAVRHYRAKLSQEAIQR